MNISPELKQQLAEQKQQCVFCKIISKEIDSKIVFEDGKTMAILDQMPIPSQITTKGRRATRGVA